MGTLWVIASLWICCSHNHIPPRHTPPSQMNQSTQNTRGQNPLSSNGASHSIKHKFLRLSDVISVVFSLSVFLYDVPYVSPMFSLMFPMSLCCSMCFSDVLPLR